MSYEESPPADAQLESRWESEAQERQNHMSERHPKWQPVEPGLCATENCDRPVQRRVWCENHYRQLLRTGQIGRVQTNRSEPTIDRLLRRVGLNGECWEWLGYTRSDGYGVINDGGKSRKVHIVSYEHYVGAVPLGLVLDHTCRNRGCVNPDHLEAVTGRENTLRGVGPTAVNAAKTQCDKGHPYTPENSRPRADGGRRCLTCDRAYKREWMRNERMKAKAGA